jgi:hypothetical protein
MAGGVGVVAGVAACVELGVGVGVAVGIDDGLRVGVEADRGGPGDDAKAGLCGCSEACGRVLIAGVATGANAVCRGGSKKSVQATASMAKITNARISPALTNHQWTPGDDRIQRGMRYQSVTDRLNGLLRQIPV